MADFLKKIDWANLRTQKSWLLTQGAGDEAEGLLGLLDAVQDYACDVLGVSEEEVFGVENVPCKVCGDTETPLHYNHACGNCGLVETEEGPNRWKLTRGDDSDDVLDYFTSAQKAQNEYATRDQAGEAIRLYSCFEDVEGDLSEWSLEKWNNDVNGQGGVGIVLQVKKS